VPPLLASRAMADTGGTGLAGALAFRVEAVAHLARFKAALGAIIAGDGVVTPERLATMPQFRPPMPTRNAIPATLWLAALAALFAGMAARNFARVQLA
jgi:hypothetical protein